MCSAHDLWGPQRTALSICSVVQGGVVNLTGAPWYLSFLNRRRAGWLTLSRVEKSPLALRCLTNDCHPTRVINSTSRRINSPSSSDVTLLGRLALVRLEGGCEPAGSARLPLEWVGGDGGCGCVKLLLCWGWSGNRRVEFPKGVSSFN